MCNTLNIKALELYCNIKKWNIELDTLSKKSLFSFYLLLIRYSYQVLSIVPQELASSQS